MFLVKLIICISIVVPTIKSLPCSKQEYSEKECKQAEKTSFIVTNMFQPIAEKFTETMESAQKYCYPVQSAENFNHVDSNIRKRREVGSISLSHTWMGLSASHVITLISVTLLILNILLLMYILIKHSKLPKSKKKQQLKIFHDDEAKMGIRSSVSSAFSTPRLSGGSGYPSSSSETDGNEASSMNC